MLKDIVQAIFEPSVRPVEKYETRNLSWFCVLKNPYPNFRVFEIIFSVKLYQIAIIIC